MVTRSRTYRALTSALIGATILRVMIFGLPIAFVLVPILTFLSYSFWSMIDGRPVAQFTLENYA